MVNPRLCETARPACLKIRDRIIKVEDFKTFQRAVGPRFRDFCLECRDFETGLIFSEMHHFLIDHSIPPQINKCCSLIVYKFAASVSC